MASWNVGPSRINGVDNGLLDLKALLNQAIGGGLGNSLGGNSLGGNSLGGNSLSGNSLGGGINSAIGSGSSRGSGLSRIGGGGPSAVGSGSGSSGGFGNSGGILDGGLNSAFGNGAVSSNTNGSPFFDPFASMSTFGFFNPKDPSSNNLSMQNACNPAPGSGMGGGGGGNPHMNSGMGSHPGMVRNGQSKSPTSYHSGASHNSHSPAFPPSHSPTFFGGSSSNHQNNHYSSSSNFSSSTSKFPISTFSIDDTLSVRDKFLPLLLILYTVFLSLQLFFLNHYKSIFQFFHLLLFKK